MSPFQVEATTVASSGPNHKAIRIVGSVAGTHSPPDPEDSHRVRRSAQQSKGGQPPPSRNLQTLIEGVKVGRGCCSLLFRAAS
ncbi:hypothetical protein LIA77_06549 [Sarocladium implicatum]|nr:hypothetical protein LIA77_06549 [Sarocladium implicatum]